MSPFGLKTHRLVFRMGFVVSCPGSFSVEDMMIDAIVGVFLRTVAGVVSKIYGS